MFSVVWSNGTIESVEVSGVELEYARELAEFYASEHSERISVSYWQGDFAGNTFKLNTNNGTTIAYSVREDETKMNEFDFESVSNSELLAELSLCDSKCRKLVSAEPFDQYEYDLAINEWNVVYSETLRRMGGQK